jgi:hypothetical protein
VANVRTIWVRRYFSNELDNTDGNFDTIVPPQKPMNCMGVSAVQRETGLVWSCPIWEDIKRTTKHDFVFESMARITVTVRASHDVTECREPMQIECSEGCRDEQFWDGLG